MQIPPPLGRAQEEDTTPYTCLIKLQKTPIMSTITYSLILKPVPADSWYISCNLHLQWWKLKASRKGGSLDCLSSLESLTSTKNTRKIDESFFLPDLVPTHVAWLDGSGRSVEINSSIIIGAHGILVLSNGKTVRWELGWEVFHTGPAKRPRAYSQNWVVIGPRRRYQKMAEQQVVALHLLFLFFSDCLLRCMTDCALKPEWCSMNAELRSTLMPWTSNINSRAQAS